jgi:hypothetical protein
MSKIVTFKNTVNILNKIHISKFLFKIMIILFSFYYLQTMITKIISKQNKKSNYLKIS